jgi:hypothetical protein
MGSVVRAAPGPISARAATMETVPSGPMETKMWGSLTTPFGMLAAPVGYSLLRVHAERFAARTRPPVATRPFITSRRLTLVSIAAAEA